MITYNQIEEVNKELKTTDVKGKDYVEVNQRIKAFRKLFPNGSITSEILYYSDGVITIQSTIKDEDGKILSTGLAQEKESSSFINKTSFVENCETSAVGRALGMLGLGIDTSVASAEEVANAIENQNKPDKMKNLKPLTEEQAQILLNVNFPPTWLKEKFGVNTIRELNQDQASSLIKAIEKKKNEVANK